MSENMTVDEARFYLMGDDILPMSAIVDEGADLEDASVRSGGDASKRVQALSSGEADSPEANDAIRGDADDEPEAHAFAEDAVGLGVDIVEIERMESILERRPSFAEQVFSIAEQLYCNRMAHPATHYALRFAAKEAVVKALGTGFSEGVWVRDIEVDRDKRGKPFIKLSGRARELADEQGVRALSLSMSHTRTDAVACVMAVTESSLRATEKRKDPMEELTRQFKETRKILDEL